jgi:hypothetical protein
LRAIEKEYCQSGAAGGNSVAEKRRLERAAGVGAAFGGGMLVFLGLNRAKHAPPVTVGPDRTVSKQLSW